MLASSRQLATSVTDVNSISKVTHFNCILFYIQFNYSSTKAIVCIELTTFPIPYIGLSQDFLIHVYNQNTDVDIKRIRYFSPL